MRAVLILVMLLCATTSLALAQARTDTALRLLDRARSPESLRTARIEWVHQELDRSRLESGIFSTRFYSWQAAPNRFVNTYYGDDEGVLFRDAAGNPESAGYSFAGPAACLHDADGIWVHREGSPTVELQDKGLVDDLYGLKDLRTLGTEPLANWDTIEERLREAGMTPFRYSASEQDGLVVVTAVSEPLQTETGPLRSDARTGAISWWLDPQRGYNAVRVTCAMEGMLLFEHQITLANYDGVWFPQRVESYAHAPTGERKLMSLTEVLSAEFNRPEHPQELGPADLGLEPGMTIVDKRSGPGRGSRVWDGTKPILPEEYRERREAGELVPGPSVLRHEARFNARIARRRAEQAAARQATQAPPPAPDVAETPPRGASAGASNPALQAEVASPAATQPAAAPAPAWADVERAARSFQGGAWRRADTLWEAYTRAFIARYRLDDEQAQLAWRTCRECQEEARAHVERVRPELEQAERLLADATDDLQRMKARAELTLLVRPLDEIFTRRLQPKLEKLPTRAQRAAAETSAAPPLSTRPAAAE